MFDVYEYIKSDSKQTFLNPIKAGGGAQSSPLIFATWYGHLEKISNSKTLLMVHRKLILVNNANNQITRGDGEISQFC